MDNAQGLINAKRAGAEVENQRIVQAFIVEMKTIKDGHPDLFAELLTAMSDILKANPEPSP